MEEVFQTGIIYFMICFNKIAIAEPSPKKSNAWSVIQGHGTLFKIRDEAVITCLLSGCGKTWCRQEH